MNEWTTLVDLSTQVLNTLPADYHAAYFELLHHTVIASATSQAMYIEAGYNQLYASQARSQTNAKADSVGWFFEHDADIRDEYHGLLDGKWDHMMSQTHLGCECPIIRINTCFTDSSPKITIGNVIRTCQQLFRELIMFTEPMLDTMPSITRVQKRQVALAGAMRLSVEGSKGAWPGDNSNQCAQGYNCPVRIDALEVWWAMSHPLSATCRPPSHSIFSRSKPVF